MTERSLYPNGVEVQQRDLAYTESTKSAQIRQRTVDILGSGRITGLLISVNSGDATRIDVSAGRAYTENGEQVVFASTTSGVQLSDYTNDVDNYIVAQYTETATTPAPHETDSTTRNTRTEHVGTIRVFTLAELNAIVATLDSDLSLPARDRMAILGIVNADGSGNALEAADIIQSTAALAQTIAVRFSELPGIEPVSVSFLSLPDSATTATGTLRQVATDVAAGGRSFTLAFTGPQSGDSLGSAVAVASAGQYTLTSNLGDQLVVYADPAYMEQFNPTASPVTTDRTVTFEAIYENQRFLPAGTQDDQHRDINGTQQHTPDLANPHGTSLLDLALSFLRSPPVAFQRTGTITGGQNRETQPVISTESAYADATEWELHWEGRSDGPLGAVRVFTHGSGPGADTALGGSACITVNANISAAGEWFADQTGVSAARLVLGGPDESGNRNLSSRFDFRATTSTPWAESAWDANNMAVTPSGVLSNLFRVLRNDLRGDAVIGGVNYQPFLLMEPRSSAALTDSTATNTSPGLRIYWRYDDASGVYDEPILEATWNAAYNSLGTNFVPDFTGQDALRLQIDTRTVGSPNFTLQRADASGGNFAEAAWLDFFDVEGGSAATRPTQVNVEPVADNMITDIFTAVPSTQWVDARNPLTGSTFLSNFTSGAASILFPMPRGFEYTVTGFSLNLGDTPRFGSGGSFTYVFEYGIFVGGPSIAAGFNSTTGGTMNTGSASNLITETLATTWQVTDAAVTSAGRSLRDACPWVRFSITASSNVTEIVVNSMRVAYSHVCLPRHT